MALDLSRLFDDDDEVQGGQQKTVSPPSTLNTTQTTTQPTSGLNLSGCLMRKIRLHKKKKKLV